MLGNWFKTTILMAGIVVLFGAVDTSLSTNGVQNLFSTHPQTQERVARLMAMAY